eukprot:7180040-Pyramimonas_sp.AAC.1
MGYGLGFSIGLCLRPGALFAVWPARMFNVQLSLLSMMALAIAYLSDRGLSYEWRQWLRALSKRGFLVLGCPAIAAGP